MVLLLCAAFMQNVFQPVPTRGPCACPYSCLHHATQAPSGVWALIPAEAANMCLPVLFHTAARTLACIRSIPQLLLGEGSKNM
jgi:hypothetical protein